MNRVPDQRLLDLCTIAWERSLTDAEVAELDDMLRDPAVRRMYVELIWLFGDMAWQYSPAVAVLPSHSEPSARRPIDTVRRWAIAAGLLIAATIGIVAALRGVTPPPEPDEVASVVGVSRGATWAPDSQAPAPGDRLHAGYHELLRGTLELTLDSGADITVHAPAKVAVVGDNEMRLDYGKLVAQVGPGSRGLLVQGPSVRVTDLGTAFAIDADRTGRAAVTVLDGSIAATILDKRGVPIDTVFLRQGHSIQVDAERNVEAVDTSDDRFSWVGGERDSAEVRLLARYSLDERGTDIADSAGLGLHGRRVATIDPDKRSPGSHVEGSGAAPFNGDADHTIDLGSPEELNLRPTLDRFTISLWCRVEPGAHGAIFSKTSASDKNRNVSHYYIFARGVGTPHTGRLSVAIGGVTHWSTMPYINDGQWHHVVAAVGLTSVDVYLDGEQVLSGGAIGSQTAPDQPVYIGARRTPQGFTLRNGAVDDLRIYLGTLDREGVLELYEREKGEHEQQ